MKFKSAAAIALGIAMVGGSLRADDAKAPAWYANTTVHGYVDGYYQHNMNGMAPLGRAFDSATDSFTISGAKIGVANMDSASGTGGELDVLYGPMAAVYNGTNLGVLSSVTIPGSTAPSALSSLAIEQAFVTQAMGPLTLKFGKALTFVGNEGTDTAGNWNYSRSLLFTQEPFYNTGLSGTWAVTNGLSLMAYVGDGNSVDVEPVQGPDFGAQVGFTAVKGLGLTLNFYSAPTTLINYATSATPPVGITEYSRVDMLNFIASYQIVDSLAFAGEYLTKMQPVPGDASNFYSSSINSDGYALYLDYKTPLAGLSIDPRYEQWFNSSYQYVNSTFTGVVGVPPSQFNEFTLTIKYAKGPLTHYLEYRNDASPKDVFVTGAALNSTGVQTTSNSENTVTYAAVYSF